MGGQRCQGEVVPRLHRRRRRRRRRRLGGGARAAQTRRGEVLPRQAPGGKRRGNHGLKKEKSPCPPSKEEQNFAYFIHAKLSSFFAHALKRISSELSFTCDNRVMGMSGRRIAGNLVIL